MEPLTREETLRVLKSMGVELPETTKLPDAVLDKRLRDALDASQYKDKLSSVLLDLTSIKKWPLAKPGEVKQWPLKSPRDLAPPARSVFHAIRRGNFNEAAQNYREELATGKRSAPQLYVDPFMDLRQTLMGLGMYLDGGARWCVLQDQEKEHCAVNLRFVSVLEVNEQTPAIVVLYRAFNKSTVFEGVEWIYDQVESNDPAIGENMVNVTATPLEQKVLLKLLKVNSHLVPPDFPIERKRGEERFSTSVLLPVGPLEFDALAKLNEKQGCSVCGKRTTSRCAQCQSVSYCGPECQRADWPAHKQTCRSLKGGQWCTTPFRTLMPGLNDQYVSVALFNRYTSTGGSGTPDIQTHKQEDVARTPPPNVWGDKLFLVKIQIHLGPGLPTHMMLYDMKRSFQVYLVREDAPQLFMDVLTEMAGPRGGYGGSKMYRWAKRSGEWQFDICLDREPKTEIKW